MASKKAARAPRITRQECVETVLRAGEACGQGTAALSWVFSSSGENGELSEMGWGGG